MTRPQSTANSTARHRTERTIARRALGRRLLRVECLEDRRLLAQTTGLFFNDPDASEGYTLFSPNTSTSTYLIDRGGYVVNTWTSAYTPGLIGALLEDGSLVRAGASGSGGQGGNGFINAAGAGGLIERFDWEGNKTWEFSYSNASHLQHHDIEIMPNGNILLIAWELRSEAQATAAGRDPNLPGPGFLYPDSIVEVQPDLVNGGGTVVWEWHVWDHLVQEFDATKANYHGPTGVQDHPELIDLNYVSTFDEGAGDHEDWTHANGLDYNPELDQIILSVREFSEFWIIDHSTTTAQAAGHTGGNSGKGGDLLYRWGNPQAYDRGDASDRVLYYQHNAIWVKDGSPGAGNITVLNNGFGRPGTDYTSVEEIAPPVDMNGNYTLSPGQAYGPTTTVSTYNAPVEHFSAIISGAQRLENGNTLISYGVAGKFIEVTPAGEEVWKYVNPFTGFGTLGPEQTIPGMGFPAPLDSLRINFTFRALDYPDDYLAQLNFPGDVNFDGTVDIFDVGLVSEKWLTLGPTGDADKSGQVNIFDIGVISENWMNVFGEGASSLAASATVAAPAPQFALRADSPVGQTETIAAAPSTAASSLLVPMIGSTAALETQTVRIPRSALVDAVFSRREERRASHFRAAAANEWEADLAGLRNRSALAGHARDTDADGADSTDADADEIEDCARTVAEGLLRRRDL